MNDFYIKYFPVLLKMPVDKFGRIIRDAKRKVEQETTASDLSVTEMNNYFVRKTDQIQFLVL